MASSTPESASNERLFVGYLEAYGRVVGAGYAEDIHWADSLRYLQPDAHYVVQEGAWVILNSGFRATVARKLWPSLSTAFKGWVPDAVDDSCVEAGLKVLNSEGKIKAMRALARIVQEEGVARILEDAKDPPKLRRLPWIGNITCWHLAKVLGADVIKPDVHLQRAAVAAGFVTPLDLCKVLSKASGDRLTVIDSVLWRYGERKKLLGWPGWRALWGRPEENQDVEEEP